MRRAFLVTFLAYLFATPPFIAAQEMIDSSAVAAIANSVAADLLNRPPPEELRTERLRIRRPDPDVAPAVNTAIRESFDTLTRWMEWADHVPSVEETRDRLVRARQQFIADEDYGFHLFTADSGLFIGSGGLHPRSGDVSRWEIGYWLRDTATGQGYATEAVRAIAAAGFKSLDLAAIEIRASARNVGSHRVARRAGFVLEAVVSDGRIDPGGEPTDTHVYVLSRDAA